MAKVTAVIEDPLGFLKKGRRIKGALLTGEYISSVIRGSYLKGVTKIPSRAVHNRETIYTVGPGDLLEIKKIKILWQDEEHIYTKSLETEAKVIVSHVATPIEGLKLNVLDDGEKNIQQTGKERP